MSFSVAAVVGMFGFIILVILIIPMYYIPASPPFTSQAGHLEDPFDAFAQMRQNWQIILASVGKCGLTILIFCTPNLELAGSCSHLSLSY